jgi:hypothetical protein
LNKISFLGLLSKFTDSQLLLEVIILICHGFLWIVERLEIIYNENRQITDFPSENKYDMRKMYLKSDKPVVRGPHTKGEIAAKSIEDKIILREQILDGLKDFRAKGRKIKVLPPEKAPHVPDCNCSEGWSWETSAGLGKYSGINRILTG